MSVPTYLVTVHSNLCGGTRHLTVWYRYLPYRMHFLDICRYRYPVFFVLNHRNSPITSTVGTGYHGSAKFDVSMYGTFVALSSCCKLKFCNYRLSNRKGDRAGPPRASNPKTPDKEIKENAANSKDADFRGIYANARFALRHFLFKGTVGR